MKIIHCKLCHKPCRGAKNNTYTHIYIYIYKPCRGAKNNTYIYIYMYIYVYMYDVSRYIYTSYMYIHMYIFCMYMCDYNFLQYGIFWHLIKFPKSRAAKICLVAKIHFQPCHNSIYTYIYILLMYIYPYIFVGTASRLVSYRCAKLSFCVLVINKLIYDTALSLLNVCRPRVCA